MEVTAMFSTGKVVWKEGMFLEPQHFQQAERHLLDILAHRLAAHVPYGYGVTQMQLDDDAVVNGRIVISRCSGVLPDGTVFDCPDSDPPPPDRSFAEHFGPRQQHLDVYLALPALAEGGANVSGPDTVGSGPARYTANTIAVADDALGLGTKEIEIGTKNLTVRFGDESLDGFSALRVARLVRTPNGDPVFDKKHIAPCLRLGASPWIIESLRGVLELLHARITSLSQARRQRGGGAATFDSRDETSYRMLQVLNASVPLLMHHHESGQSHPRELFLALVQLCGSLCTFSADYDAAELGRYDHDSLASVFERLFAVVRAVLGADFGASCLRFDLEPAGPAMYGATVGDRRLFDEARFFLGVKADVPEKDLVLQVLQRAKMSSRERLDVLIASAMPGLQLVHVPRPPERLAAKPSYVYFALGQRGDTWNGIKGSGSPALYFPNEYEGLHMELLALRED
ncbi:MAG: type VI secretion system baseplate subunit TssK [Chitinivibrionales bacterium]|nr:type VI secretion system baseplate subunit TssK [Chitinivibrionales bacterium]